MRRPTGSAGSPPQRVGLLAAVQPCSCGERRHGFKAPRLIPVIAVQLRNLAHTQ